MKRGCASRFLLAGLLAALTLAGPAGADRLHLESGGHVDTEDWWIEGSWIRYESKGGVIGIPRSSVVRIERGTPASDASPRGWNPGSRSSVRRTARSADDKELRALMEEGRAALDGRDFERASARFLEVIRSAPGLHAARVGYALAEIALGHDSMALSVVQDGLVMDSERADLHELLGDLRYRDERVEDALAAWRRAFELSPGDRVREKILKAERELHASRDYEFAASSHFNLRYDGTVDLDLAASVMDYLEEQFWELTGVFRHTPPQPITVQLFPRREFREVTRSPEWVGGLYDGKIRVPLGGLERLHTRARQVLTHELTHAIIHAKTRGNAPRWLHEGLAQISEPRRLSDEDRAAVAARLAGIEPASWEENGFSYPMALSLTRYLESRRGMDGLVHLLELLGDGNRIDPALREIYGQDYDSICRSWAHAAIEEAGR